MDFQFCNCCTASNASEIQHFSLLSLHSELIPRQDARFPKLFDRSVPFSRIGGGLAFPPTRTIAVEVLDLIEFGSSMSLRSFARLGSSLSLVAGVMGSGCLSVLDMAHFGYAAQREIPCRTQTNRPLVVEYTFKTR